VSATPTSFKFGLLDPPGRMFGLRKAAAEMVFVGADEGGVDITGEATGVDDDLVLFTEPFER
jgi:hypothetical protein